MVHHCLLETLIGNKSFLVYKVSLKCFVESNCFKSNLRLPIYWSKFKCTLIFGNIYFEKYVKFDKNLSIQANAIYIFYCHILLHTCASYVKLPSYIKTMDLISFDVAIKRCFHYKPTLRGIFGTITLEKFTLHNSVSFLKGLFTDFTW